MNRIILLERLGDIKNVVIKEGQEFLFAKEPEIFTRLSWGLFFYTGTGHSLQLPIAGKE